MKESIVPLLTQTIRDWGASEYIHTWETPLTNGKNITCRKDYQNNFVFDIRERGKSRCSISQEGVVTNPKGKEIKNRYSLSKIHKSIIKIADNLYFHY
jgi:hypothetical protein